LDDNHAMDRLMERVPQRQQRERDLAFWLSRTMAERIAAVEALRAQAFTPAQSPDAEPRPQRVCRVARRAGR
jgi:hypothetical protein